MGVCGSPVVLLEDTVETDSSSEAASTSLDVDEEGVGDGGLIFTKSINAPILENYQCQPRGEELFKKGYVPCIKHLQPEPDILMI